MKQTSKMVMVAVALLAGVSGTAWANGTEIPPPEPSPYTPPPPPPPVAKPAPVVKTGGPYISGAIGIGFPGSFKTEYSPYDHDHGDDDDNGGCCGGYSAYNPNSYDEPGDSVDTSNGSSFDLKSGLVLNGAIGYNFGSTRLEGAIGYQKHDFSDIDEDISLLTFMANAYYDFGKDASVRPYIMGGIGIAHVDMSWTSENEDVFAWQIGAGVGVKVAERTTLDLGYRYLKPSKFDTHGLGDGDIACHNIMLGIRYQF